MKRHRDTARAIVALRRTLIQGFIRAVAGTPDHDLEAEFDFLVRSMPLRVLTDRNLERRVMAPVRRQIDREGLLRHVDPADHRTQAAIAADPDAWRNV